MPTQRFGGPGNAAMMGHQRYQYFIDTLICNTEPDAKLLTVRSISREAFPEIYMAHILKNAIHHTFPVRSSFKLV